MDIEKDLRDVGDGGDTIVGYKCAVVAVVDVDANCGGDNGFLIVEKIGSLDTDLKSQLVYSINHKNQQTLRW